MLIVGRAVAGMGGSGLMNGGMQIIYLSVPSHRRPALMGILMSFSQLGLVSGPLLGGVLTEYASWRWCFYINLPIGAVATFCIAMVQIPDGKKKRGDGNGASIYTLKESSKELLHELDLKGFLLFAGFSLMVVLALQWGGTNYSWSSATIIGLFVGCGCALLVFAVQEYRIGDRAMFPWSIVRRTAVWSSGITMFFFFGSQMIGNYYLPIYFQTVRNASPAMSGVYILPSILSSMLMAVASGALVSRWGYYLPWMMVSAVLAGIGNGLLSTVDLHTHPVKWIWYQVIMGLGRGCGLQMVSKMLYPD
jgi:MFS family permease